MSTFFAKKKKFEKGYLTMRKNKLSMNILLNLVFAFAIFILGLFLNKMEARNIFSVLAMLFILPIARSISILLVLVRNHELRKETLLPIEEAIEGRGILLYSPVFTSKERSMSLDLIALFEDRVLGLNLPEKEAKTNEKYKKNLEEAKKYIDFHLKNQGLGETIVIYEDSEKFIKAFPNKALNEESLKELMKLKTSMEYFIV